jgi:hypothetical protein
MDDGVLWGVFVKEDFSYFCFIEVIKVFIRYDDIVGYLLTIFCLDFKFKYLF